MKFEDFFAKATETSPYPYQICLATAEEFAELIRAPTGAGKTAAVVLGWLWRRYFAEPETRLATPRRLVYCLPMRVLVEQTVREAEKWIHELKRAKVIPPGTDIPVNVLMGGVETDQWFLHPEQSAILIGTQDMLLSRALDRGYAASRFHWPIDFGLLNNDCLWVFDEPQLMGSGVSTSAQLAGLRAALGTFGPCPSVWMSATLEQRWLDTVDFAGRRRGEPLELTDEDYGPERPLHKRMTAEKTLHSLGVTATKDGKEVARLVVHHHHVPGTQTLVMSNTVDRAKAIYKAIREDKAAPKDVLLVHSRFRPVERQALNDRLTRPAVDRIIVATQVVEAGVDLSARTLLTELAPWASLVQRIGRCNRTGDNGPGRVFWVDLDDKQSPPYESADLQFARAQLTLLEGHDVSPKALDDFKREQRIILRFVHTHVLRRRDLLDLFDTSPDLSGNDVDVSRFVRGDAEDNDVQVFWRDLGAGGPVPDEPGPDRRELCNVPIGAFKEFLKKERQGRKPIGYLWDHFDRLWRPIRNPDRDVYPGLAVLLPTAAGGYSEPLGWAPESAVTVVPGPHALMRSEGTEDDAGACGPELTVAEHTRNVCNQVDRIVKELGDLIEGWSDRLSRAARWHDAGKGHDAYQHGIRAANPALDPMILWAKSGTDGRMYHGRRGFRHELASALAALQQSLPFETAYLIATHHGKVRLSIRALPDEEPPREDVSFALGVHHGDRLGPVDLGGETCPELTLDLSPMQLGGEASWTARALALRDELGPFRLAYLEALLRAADQRASAAERAGGRT
jgi:CRISPR-associated endonuclease/helicase Cas3